MKRTTKIRLAIIVPALLVMSIGAWIGVNMLVSRQLSLVALVKINDTDAVDYICKWDPKQAVTPEQHADPGVVQQSTPDKLFGLLMFASLRKLRCAEEILLDCHLDTLPLHWAARRGNLAAITVLTQSGASPSAPDFYGATPLHFAVHSPEATVMLVELGADLDAKDQSGRTPLAWAVRTGETRTAEALVNSGATVNIKDDSGFTPLDEANSRTETREVIELLRKHGAKTGEELKAETK